MPEIPRFTAEAPRRGSIDVPSDDGTAAMLASIAESSGQLARRLGNMADLAAKREGEAAGAAAAMQVQMPGVEFAFDGKSAATTPGKPFKSGDPVATDLPPEARALLNAIAGGESGGSYNVRYTPQGAAHFADMSRHPGIFVPGPHGPTSAAGRYQFVKSTWDRLGGGDFSPANQDRQAWKLAQRDYLARTGRNLQTDLKAGGLTPAIVSSLSGTWQAFAKTPGRHIATYQASLARFGTDPVVTGSTKGPIEKGNIDLGNRPVVNNSDGTVSTVRSISIEEDGKEVLIPTVSPDGKILSDDDAIALYRRTGQHLGKFDNAKDATAYANDLHNSQAQTYSAPTTPGAVTVNLTGQAGAVPQMQAGTIRGDAYNRAALDIHVNRLDTAMRSQMEAVALQHEGDPGGLSSALDALRAGFMRDLPPPAAALIDQSFSAQKLSLQRQAVTKFNQNLESANLAAFEENVAARTASVYRLAQNAGIDADADAAISNELGALTAQIDASPMTPLQKSRAKAEAVSNVLSARVLGGFDQLKDPAQRATYVQRFQEEWRSGEGLSGRMDLATYDKINGELMRGVQADQVAANKRDTALRSTINGQISTLKKGWPVPQANRDFLKGEVAKTNDPQLAADLNFLDGLADWQKAHVAARPEVIDAQITAMQAKIQREGATEAALTTLDVMEGLRDEMRKGLANDPLTWANRAGVAQVEPLNFSDGSTLSASLSERVADAQAVAQHYGTQPKYFTQAETDGLKKMLAANPLTLPSIVSSLSAGLGAATPQALGEISKEAPLLAHVAGLVNATGSQRVATEAAEALERRRQPGYKSTLPTAAKLQSAASETLGPALAALPGTQAGALETAAALFETRAAARGIDAEHFDESGNAARTLYQEALDEVLGATTRDGVKYGGLTEVNGVATIAPPDIAADSLQDMVSDISADDLIFQAPIGTANGLPIRPEQLRQARLVMVAQGRYRLALGDVAGGDPRFVPAGDGGYFELDVGMLKRSQEGRGLAAGDTASMRRRRTIYNWANQTR